jgi:hypothetical protein
MVSLSFLLHGDNGIGERMAFVQAALHKNAEPLKEFLAKLSDSLILVNAAQPGRPNLAAQPPAPRSRAGPSGVIPLDVRRNRLNHLPEHAAKHGRCAQCHTNNTNIQCTKCKKLLCLVKNRNCFINYHI